MSYFRKAEASAGVGSKMVAPVIWCRREKNNLYAFTS